MKPTLAFGAQANREVYLFAYLGGPAIDIGDGDGLNFDQAARVQSLNLSTGRSGITSRFFCWCHHRERLRRGGCLEESALVDFLVPSF